MEPYHDNPPQIRLFPGKVLVWLLPTLLAIIFYYYWNAHSSHGNFFDQDGGAYAQLAQAFLNGQTALMIEPDPKLLKAPDPYSPDADRGYFYWDYSYYKGKYYLYFGPTPSLFLFCPYRLITGQDMNKVLAFLIIAILNVFLFTLLVRLMVRSWFPHTPAYLQATLIFTYGFSNLALYHMRRGDMYETEEMIAATFLLLFFVTLVQILTVQRYLVFWLFLNSFAYGCAAASRVSYILVGTVLLFIWVYLLKKNLVHPRTSFLTFTLQTMALFLPALLIGVGLAWYNKVRFEDPLQFGAIYCLTTYKNTNPIFSLEFIPYRLYQDLIMPPKFYPKFPFVFPIPQAFSGDFMDRLCWENACSVFSCFPICWFALLWMKEVKSLFRIKTTSTHVVLDDCEKCHLEKISFFGFSVFSAWVMVCLPLFLFFHVCIRHVIDIIMPLLVLSTLSIFACRERGPFHTVYLILLIAFAVKSIYVGFAFGLIGSSNWIHVDVPN